MSFRNSIGKSLLHLNLFYLSLEFNKIESHIYEPKRKKRQVEFWAMAELKLGPNLILQNRNCIKCIHKVAFNVDISHCELKLLLLILIKSDKLKEPIITYI